MHFLQSLGFCLDLQLEDEVLDRRFYIKAKPEEEYPFCEHLLRQEPVKELLRRYVPLDMPAFFHWKDQHLFFTIDPVLKGGGTVGIGKAQRIVQYLHEWVTTLDGLPLSRHRLVWPEEPEPWFRTQYPGLQRWEHPGRSFTSPSGAPVAVCYSDNGEIKIEK